MRRSAPIALAGGAPHHRRMPPSQRMIPEVSPAPPPGASLSWRLAGLALAVIVVTELLLFLPAMVRERQDWLEERLLAAHVAIEALPSTQAQFALADRPQREALLRLAGVMSVRLQEAGRPMAVLAPMGQVHAAGLLDLRKETPFSRLVGVMDALRRARGQTVLVIGPSPRRPQALLSVVLRQEDLDAHLRAAARRIALHALAVAVPTGMLTYVALLLLLVRPLRRLTVTIAAFRADPERLPPSVVPVRADEVGVAARELAAMQAELRGALWRNARLAAIGAAVARLSHDLRGILAPALLGAERLQASGDPALRRTGDSIAHSVERATGLMHGALEFAGEVPATSLGAVPLRALAEEVATEVRVGHPRLSVGLEVDNALAVRGDRASLGRALANLVRNAAEAGAGAVTLAAAAEGQVVMVTLADDGPGLPGEVRARLFQPFVTSGKAGGTGLGLAIARDLVRAQGGGIELVRSGAGGTVFRLVLRREAG